MQIKEKKLEIKSVKTKYGSVNYLELIPQNPLSLAGTHLFVSKFQHLIQQAVSEEIISLEDIIKDELISSGDEEN